MGSDGGKGLAGAVKLVMIVQGVGVAALSFWLGKEYVNNIYLRQYVQNVAWTYLPVMAFLATFGVAVGVSEAYARLKGSEGVEAPMDAYAPAHRVRLTAESGFGFESGLPSSTGPAFGLEGRGLAGDSGGSESGISFAQVFSESRPPVLLKHVEAPETQDPYAPRPFPVVRRLEPAVEPVEEERPRVTPRVLNRIGPAQALLVPLPPVLRQIGSNYEEEAGSEEKLPRGRTRRYRKTLEAEETSGGE